MTPVMGEEAHLQGTAKSKSRPTGRKHARKGLCNLGNSFVLSASRAMNKMSWKKEMSVLSEQKKRWVSSLSKPISSFSPITF